MAVTEVNLDKAPQATRDGRFWPGVLTGVFTGLLFMTAAFFYLFGVRGLQVSIDQENLAARLRVRLREMAAEEFPIVAAKAADDAAAALLESGNPPELSLEIAGRRVELPPEAVQAFWRQFGELTREAMAASLKDFDLTPYANQLADGAYEMLRKTLNEQICGQTFRLRANGWLSLPVTVRGLQEPENPG
ncbi:MAG: hypothetical protein ACM3XS_05175 [Bacteroidota bacterium]